jgi:hypothetical protein
VITTCLVDVAPITWRVTGETSGVGQQRGEPLHPPVDGDMVDLDTAFDQQFLHVSVRGLKRRYHRTATTITSGGNRYPANADFGGGKRRARSDSFTGQACLEHADAQRNGPDARGDRLIEAGVCGLARTAVSGPGGRRAGGRADSAIRPRRE